MLTQLPSRSPEQTPPGGPVGWADSTVRRPRGGLRVAGTGRGTCSVEEADTGGHVCHYFDDMSGAGKAIETGWVRVSLGRRGGGERGENPGWPGTDCRQALTGLLSVTQTTP